MSPETSNVELDSIEFVGHAHWLYRFKIEFPDGEKVTVSVSRRGPTYDLNADATAAYAEMASMLRDLAKQAEAARNRWLVLAASRSQ